MKAKEIILLILIIVVGILFTQLYTGEIDVYFDLEDDFIIVSNEFDYEDYQELEPPFPSLIQVTNSNGDIEILGTDENKITVSLRKKVWRRKEEKAQEIADELKMLSKKRRINGAFQQAGMNSGEKTSELLSSFPSHRVRMSK